MFVGDRCGKAEEASDFYIATFENAKRGELARYPAGMEPDKEGTVMFTDFMLEGQWFVAMDSAREHNFAFNEAISFMVNCENQQEIDHYWQALSAVPEAEQCGWLKDAYGLSWQIVPAALSANLEPNLLSLTQYHPDQFDWSIKLTAAAASFILELSVWLGSFTERRCTS